MRVISLDQFEFESSSSEESLEIAVASRGKFPFPSVESFIAARIGVAAARALPEPVAFERRLDLGQMVDYLNRFAGIVMPDGCEWPVYRLSTEWDEQNVVVCAPTKFIHYLWRTSA